MISQAMRKTEGRGKTRGRTGRLATAVGAAVALHGLALLAVWLTPVPQTPEEPPVEIELWRPPETLARPVIEPAAAFVTPPKEALANRPTSPVRPRTPVVPVTPVPTPPPMIAPVPSSTPLAETGTGVTPRAYAEGADKGRAAATRALNKRQFCIQQRDSGRPMDKDCPVTPAKDIVLPLQPKETRPTKLCLAAREREWQKYRDGRGAYPGLRDLVDGKKKCRQGWDD